jgi:hypothetical protein
MITISATSQNWGKKHYYTMEGKVFCQAVKGHAMQPLSVTLSHFKGKTKNFMCHKKHGLVLMKPWY